jgi:hypothetical protein
MFVFYVSLANAGEYLPFSETTMESQKKNDFVLQEWEAKKKAKSILIPTDDKLVQARLETNRFFYYL